MCGRLHAHILLMPIYTARFPSMSTSVCLCQVVRMSILRMHRLHMKYADFARIRPRYVRLSQLVSFSSGVGVGENRDMSGLYRECACGEPIAKNRWRSGKRDCVSCALARCVAHNTQMNRKSGPAWDATIVRWRGMIAEESSASRENDHGNQGDGSVHH